jgi:hypothetical protein
VNINGTVYSKVTPGQVDELIAGLLAEGRDA